MTELRTKAGRRMAAALEDEIDYMGAVETILEIEAEATAAAEQRLAGLEGALRRLDHIARVYPQSLGEEAELDAALDESYRLLHPARALPAASGESASPRQPERGQSWRGRAGIEPWEDTTSG